MDFIQQAAAIIGTSNVRTGTDMDSYRTDWTGAYAGDPLCVLRPGSTAEVSDLMALASRTNTQVVPVSGNTGLAGGAYAQRAAMLSLERMNAIRDIRVNARVAQVEAGVTVARLRDAAAEENLVFPVTFGAEGSAMIGGILSTNAGGSNVLRYGNTRAQVLGLEAVLADGRVLNLMNALHKDNTGYDLKDLLIGAEGTLGIITAAMVKLAPAPARFATAMIAPASLESALEVLNALQAASGSAVEAFEYMPRAYIEAHLDMIDGAREPFESPQEVNVLVELGGGDSICALMEEVLGAAFEAGQVLDATIAQSDTQRREMWARREAAAEIAFSRQPAVVTDIALPLDALAAYFEAVRPKVQAVDPEVVDVSVAHLGDGNIHFTMYPSSAEPDLKDRLITQVEDVVREMGGSFSAEHGIGLSKLNSMRRQKDPVALEVMRAVKVALDPQGILNPGKVVPD